MTDFLIDTPSHKRWWLPDRRHQYNSVIYGDMLHWSIIRAMDHSTVISGNIDISKLGWENLSELCQALAERKYPDPGGKAAQFRRLHNVKLR